MMTGTTHAPGMAGFGLTTLANDHVTLQPLTEAHRPGLAAANTSPAIWTWQTFDIAAGFDTCFDLVLAEQAAGRWMPFAVVHPTGTVVGQTCYLDFRPEDRGIEIGATWYCPQMQGTAINPAAKLLLLDHAFAAGMVRVQFKTDVRNRRSRAAIEKLGASHEGILRSQRRRPDGTWRDTAYYSILDHEWPRLRERLVRRLQHHAAALDAGPQR